MFFVFFFFFSSRRRHTRSLRDWSSDVCSSDLERVGRILQMHANHREERAQIMAGEIAATVGLKNTTTGDTLATDTAPIRLESMDFPEPVISVAIEPKTKG